jgi:hypothetical protein
MHLPSPVSGPHCDSAFCDWRASQRAQFPAYCADEHCFAKNLPALDTALARNIVENSIRTYFRKRTLARAGLCRTDVLAFRRLQTHRNAFGHDL